MKTLLTLAFALMAFVATSNAETTLFTTDFTEASFAAAGISTTSGDDASWVLDDVNDLATTSQGVGTQARANLYTTSVYSNSTALILEVDFKTTGTTGFAIGLVEAGATFNWDPIDNHGAYGLMFILAGANGDGDGDFVFSDGSTDTNLADGTQAYTYNEVTALRFSINSDGDWTYSLDGATATTGTIAGGFDLSKSYQPYVYGRRQSTYDGASSVYSMTLSTVPGPSTLALLLLGGLIYLYARKRKIQER